jgi:hypothetical protein
LLAPSALKVRTGGRLVKLDSHTMEFFLLHSMVALFEDVVRRKAQASFPAFETSDFVSGLEPFPLNVIPEYRRRRPYLSGVLARNELHRDDSGNRRLFLRVSHGFYVPNPAMDIEIENSWINVCDLLHLDIMAEGAEKRLKDLLDVMRHVQKQGRLEPSIRLRSSPFHSTLVPRTLPSIARRVRGEDVSWEDEWEAPHSEPDPALPEIQRRMEQDAENVSSQFSPEPQPTPDCLSIPPVDPGLPLEDVLADTVETAAFPPAAPSKSAHVDDMPEMTSGRGSARLPVADESLEFAQATPQSGVTSKRAEFADAPPPLPPLLETDTPQYTLRERQMLQRIEFPILRLPESDERLITANYDHFRPALLGIVQKVLDPRVKQELLAERYNDLGYFSAAYILAGACDPALLPLLLRVAIDPELARYHLRNARFFDLPRVMATLAQKDASPVLNIAAWPRLPNASRGIILKTLALLFLWKHISRDGVVQALRQTFDAGIPADPGLWDLVLDVCFLVHPSEIMGRLRRQLSSAVCRELGVNRATLENLCRAPISVIVADARRGDPGPIRGLQDLGGVGFADKSAREEEEDAKEASPIHASLKTGRNDPCPCGSGRKFKKCCGAG